MKFFVDTAEIKDIKELYATGLLDGVTTNPSLVAKSGRNFLEVIEEICSIVPGPVSAEVASTEYQGMLDEGHAEQLRDAKRMTIANDSLKPQELDAIAKLLVVAAERTWMTSGPNTGLYPDTIENLITPKPAFIIPENLWLHTFRAQGRELAIQTQRQRGVTVHRLQHALAAGVVAHAAADGLGHLGKIADQFLD